MLGDYHCRFLECVDVMRLFSPWSAGSQGLAWDSFVHPAGEERVEPYCVGLLGHTVSRRATLAVIVGG